VDVKVKEENLGHYLIVSLTKNIFSRCYQQASTLGGDYWLIVSDFSSWEPDLQFGQRCDIKGLQSNITTNRLMCIRRTSGIFNSECSKNLIDMAKLYFK
jgi:hypothetical protein